MRQRNRITERLLRLGALALMIACLKLAADRFPGGRLGGMARQPAKGPVPDRELGTAFLPESRVRSFHQSNPDSYFDSTPPLRGEWRLLVHKSRDHAVMTYPEGGIPRLRIQIEEARSRLPWSIQLNYGRVRLDSGAYVITFRARADSTKPIRFNAAEWHPPFDGLGPYRVRRIGTAWTTFTDTILVTRSDSVSRIQFELGETDTGFEISELTLRSANSGAIVRPTTPAYSLTYEINRFGCRGGSPRADSVRRILVLGDSYAFGWGIREHDTFGAKLERYLNGLADTTPQDQVEVMNCSVPGYGFAEARTWYARLRRHWRPDIVLLVSTWNDALRESDERMPTPTPEGMSLGTPPDAATRRVLEELVRLTRMDSSALVGVLFQNTPSEAWAPTRQLLQSTLSQSGAAFLNLWPNLQLHAPWEELVVDPRSNWQPNRQAHDEAARLIGEYLSRGMVLR